ncbi:MAG TPA: SDR family oxidoreductase, partial [Dehalococcoidales bacterium]|nr:SDR family oxidoreductase [Dehalococcoidales bacterium]
MDLKLKGKKAMVTGTGSQVGFGKGIALFLAQEGCDVICADIDFEGAQKTAAEVKALGRKAVPLKVDITQKSETDAAVKKAITELGYIDILVNTAGRASGIKTFIKYNLDDWYIDVDINFRGTMNMLHSMLPHMLSRKYGKIVNFSTHAANQPTGLSGAGPYCAAKAAVTVLSKTLSGEYGPHGININVIAPGPGNTNFHKAGDAPQMAGMVENLAKAGKTVTPEEIAWAVGFLVSDISSKIV